MSIDANHQGPSPSRRQGYLEVASAGYGIWRCGRRCCGYKWNRTCPYCTSPLVDQGSYHTKALAEALDSNGISYLVCSECGVSERKREDLIAAIDKENAGWFKPAKISPGYGCFKLVATCPVCGWWYVVERGHESNGAGQPPAYHGILKSFDLSDAAIPITILQHELPKKFSDVTHVNPYRFEDYVAEVLRMDFRCEVRRLGYSRDGGIDLFLLQGDKCVAVQIKRRLQHNKPEGISPIREFVACALLKGIHDLLFVTTADRYTAGALDVASQFTAKGIIKSYKLVDLNTLQNIVCRQIQKANWEVAIEDFLAAGRGRMRDVLDPYYFMRGEHSFE